jgi:general secretion pathway protein G
MKSRPSARSRQRGVTVVELGAAVAALALVGGIAAAVISPRRAANETTAAIQTAERIRKAVVDWRSENGTGCPTLSQLEYDKVLSSDARTDDPWGQRFRVLCSGDTVTVRSAGRDGKAGTRDDIVAGGQS